MALEVFGEQTRGVLATTMCMTLYKGEDTVEDRAKQKKENGGKKEMIDWVRFMASK